MRNLGKALRLGLFLASIGGQALAQDVTLTSRDGGVQLSGQLLTYDGEFYRIDTEFGELTLDGSGVQCTGPGCPELSAYVARLSVAGAALAVDRLLPALMTSFARVQGYDLDMQGAGDQIVFQLSEGDQLVAAFEAASSSDDTALASLIGGQVNMAFSSREVLPAEIALGQEAGVGNLAAPAQNRAIALDAVVPVLSARNRISEVSLDELADVFSGKIDNWSALGGADALISLHLVAGDTIARRMLLEKVLLAADVQLSAQITYHDDAKALAAAVVRDPFALGLTTLSERGGTKPVGLKGGCGFRVGADGAALKSEDYPLTAPLFVYVTDARLPKIGREFLRFVRTPAAQVAILQAGLVDQGFGRTAIARQGERLANAIRNAGGDVGLADLRELVTEMEQRARLSVTFRFKEGAAELDGQSRSNVLLLARALETGALRAEELTFMGFSDTVGEAAENKRLSLERALAVRRAVLEAAVTFSPGQMRIRAKGLGEALPMACDDTFWGRQVNRRVEVWVR